MNPVRQQPAKRIHRQCALETDHALRFVALVCAPQTGLHQPLEPVVRVVAQPVNAAQA